MKRFLTLVLVATLTLIALLFIFNPGLLDKIWLYLIGFAGGIVGVFRSLFDKLKNTFNTEYQQEPALAKAAASPAPVPQTVSETPGMPATDTLYIPKPVAPPPPDTAFEGTTLTLLRYLDDTSTTLGLLYVRDEFFSYTLEDTHREVKIASETRIPSGTYEIGFRKQVTPLTEKYRNRFNWFKYHIEVKNVPNYSGIYIHIGNDNGDTAGCLLLADGVNASSMEKTVQYSTQAFKRFYMRISDLLNGGEKIRIVIRNEDWFNRLT